MPHLREGLPARPQAGLPVLLLRGALLLRGVRRREVLLQAEPRLRVLRLRVLRLRAERRPEERRERAPRGWGSPALQFGERPYRPWPECP